MFLRAYGRANFLFFALEVLGGYPPNEILFLPICGYKQSARYDNATQKCVFCFSVGFYQKNFGFENLFGNHFKIFNKIFIKKRRRNEYKKMKYVVSLSEEEFEMLDKFIDDLYDQLHQMSKEELKQWYLENAALQPFEKEIDGTVLYSRFLCSAEYYVLREDGPILHGTSNETVTDKLELERGWMLDKIDGIDHAQTAKFYLSRFYIFYEKNTENG